MYQKLRKVLCIAIVFLIFSTFSVYSQESSIDKIKERNVIRVAMVSSDQEPFFYTNSKGEFVGLDVSIAQGIADELGVGVVFDRSAQSFGALIPLVENKEVDLVISKLSRTLERSQRVLYSDSYVSFQQALLFDRLELAKKVSTDEGVIEYVKNLTGSIGVIANSSYHVYAQNNFPNATIKQFKNWDAVITALLEKEVSTIYRDQLEIEKLLKERPGSTINYRMVLLTDTPDDIAIAINEKDSLLLQFVNLYLQNKVQKNLTPTVLLRDYGENSE